MATTGTTTSLITSPVSPTTLPGSAGSMGRPAMEPLMTLHLELTKPVVMANGIVGARVFEGVLAGSALGGRIRASVTPHSGCIDTVVREDGWSELELRLLLATHDHSLISIRSTGVADVGPTSRPAMSMRFEAGRGECAWLNRVQAVAVGTRGRDEITFEVFALE